MRWQLDKQKYLTKEEIDRLFRRVRKLESDEQAEFGCYWKRCHMVLHLAFHGLRVSECCHVKHCDIDLQSEFPSLFVMGKGRRKRYVPISKRLVQHIRRFVVWKESVGQSTDGDNYLLESPKRPGSPYSVSGLEAMYLKALKKAGIARKTFHSARHSFGFRVYNATKDLKAVAQLLGHSSTSVSEIYTYCTFDKLSRYVEEMATKKT